MTTDTLNSKMLEFLKENGYEGLRTLEDGTIIGTLNLIYTRALVIDLNGDGWSHRYCYKDKSLATAACLAMQSGDDAPLLGYVAQRHARR